MSAVCSIAQVLINTDFKFRLSSDNPFGSFCWAISIAHITPSLCAQHDTSVLRKLFLQYFSSYFISSLVAKSVSMESKRTLTWFDSQDVDLVLTPCFSEFMGLMR